ncbi:MAG: tandem-95 repeat protein [Gemmatimonadetes bacterium]|nr:tandem-95 repeat protein [Gemmatimonadota bacterium]
MIENNEAGSALADPVLRLLPRLALAALALAASAVPASAQSVLVSNIGQTGTTANLASRDRAQGFTTGSNTYGYTLTSVEVGFGTQPDGVTVRLATGLPSATTFFATLTNPTTLVAGNNTFTAPAGTQLRAGTTYFVVVRANTGTIRTTQSGSEDSGGAAGWSIADSTMTRPSTSTEAWTLSAGARLIRVNGTAPTAKPGRPGTPSVEKGPTSGSLAVSWTAPGAGITDYDLRYYKGTMDPESESDWVTEGAPGLPVDTAHTATADTIRGLLANTAYRVQVRAANVVGESPWSASGSATTDTVPTANHAPRLLEAKVGDADQTCQVKADTNTPSARATAFPATRTSIGNMVVRGSETTEWPTACTTSTLTNRAFSIFDDRDAEQLLISIDGYTLPDNVRVLETPSVSQPAAQPSLGGIKGGVNFFGVAAFQNTDVRVDLTATDPHGASVSTHVVFEVSIFPGTSAPSLPAVSGVIYFADTPIPDLVLPAATGGDTSVRGQAIPNPYFYEVSGLPPGLSFNKSTRAISGTPTTQGTYTVTYKAEDADAKDSGDTPDPMDTAVRTFDIEVLRSINVPNAPGTPTVEKGPASGSLKVSWTAPTNSGTITDYDLRYYQGSMDPDSESDWVTEGALGLPHPDTAFTATADTITVLLANSAYRVQVRAANANGEGLWSASGSQTTATAPATNNAPKAEAGQTCSEIDMPAVLFSQNVLGGVLVSARLTRGGTVCGTDPQLIDPDGDALTVVVTGSSVPADLIRYGSVGGTQTFDVAQNGSRSTVQQIRLTYSAVAAHQVRSDTVSLRVLDPHGASATTSVVFDVSTFDGTSAPSLPAVSGQSYATYAPIPNLVLPAATGGELTSPSGVITRSAFPYSYAVSGLPPGLEFDDATRTISGTPTTTGSYTVTYSADDADGQSASRNPAARDSTDTAVRTFDITVTEGTPTAPMAPGQPTVEKGPTSGSLEVSWSAPTSVGAITDYDLRYFKGTTDPQSESDWVTEGPGAPGLPHPDSTFTATADTITALLANTMYQVQVRAANAHGEGPWSASGAATTDTVPTANHAPRLLEQKTGDANNICQVKTDTNTPSATTIVPAGARSDIGALVVRGSETTEWPTVCTTSVLNNRAFPVFDDRDAEQLLITIDDYTLPDNVRAFGGTPYVGQPAAQPGIGGVRGQVNFSGLAAFENTDVRVDVTATDPHGASVSTHLVFQVSIFPGTSVPSLTAVSDQSFTVNEEIAGLVLPAATGGDTSIFGEAIPNPYFYEVSGLPPGLSFNKSTRTISGTPTTAGSYTVTYKAEDADAKDSSDSPDPMDTAVRTFNIEVTSGAPAPAGAEVDGTKLTLTFDKKLNTATAPSATRFTVAGTTPAKTVTAVAFRSADSTKVDLTLSAGVVAGETGITVSYAKGTDANPLQGLTGVEVADFASQTVTNATPPSVTGAEVNGTVLTLAFDAALGTTAAPDPTRFTVSGTTEPTTVTEVAFSGSDATKLDLTLSPGVGIAETGIAVAYAAGNDANPLQDGSGRKVKDFTGRTVTNVTPPSVMDALVNGTELTLTFDAALSTTAAPAASRFTVEGTTAATTVTAVAFRSGDATVLDLTLSAAVGSGETGVTLAYTAGDDANPLQDGNGRRVADFTGRTVRNPASGAPSFPTTTSRRSVRENSAAGRVVGTVTATDPNGDPLTYALSSTAGGGTDHESFAIDANTGRITVAAGATLNFEAKSSYAVTVTASDGTNSASHQLTIRVLNVAEPPSAPGAPTVTRAATATSLTVTWSAPADTGARAVTDYDLRYFAGSSDPSNPSDWIEEGELNGPPNPGSATSAVLSGLTANTAYVVQVRAQGDGEGPWSASGSATTGAGGTAPPAGPPTRGAVSADGAMVTLEFAETLDATSVPDPGDFTVTLAPASSAVAASSASSEASSGGPSASTSSSAAQHRVTAVAIRGSALDLTVSPPVPAGREAVVSYTNGSAPLRTASGAKVPDFGFTATQPGAPPPPPPPPPPPTPAIAVTVEGDSALEGTAVEFTVRLSQAADSDVVLDWSTGPDDSPGARPATPNVDYRPVVDGRVTVPAGSTEAMFSVATLADFDEEGDETFAVTVTGIGLPEGVMVATATAVGTIEDDVLLPPPVQDTISVEGGSAVEGEPVTFTVRLSSAVRSDVVLRWFTSADHAHGAQRATADEDYTAVRDGRVRIVAGLTEATFAVATAADTLEEGDETFRVIITELEVPEGAGIVHSTALGTIENYTPPPNEAPSFELSEYAFELEENTDGSAQSVRLGAVSATDPDGDELTYALAAGDSTRFAVGVRNGAVLYVGPGEDFEAEPNLYELTVRASDPAGESAEAAVTVTVVNVNERPAAADDAATTDEDVAVEIDVLANDTDVEGTALRVSSVSAPSNGTAEVSAAGGVLYTPDANWYGTDSFAYEIDDGDGGTAEASVEVTVVPVNDAPEAADDAAEVDEDAEVEIDVLANDTDVDGDSLRVSSVSEAVNGTVASTDGGRVRYTPAANWHGTDSFVYEIDDGAGGTASASVEVTVLPVNDAPEAAGDAASTDEDVAVEIDVLANDTDADGDSLRVSSVSVPSNGTAEISGGGGVRYTPAANWHGTDSFTYEIDDGNGGTASAEVEVTVVPVNDAPEAVDDVASADEDGSVEIDVLANDTDIDGDGLQVSSVSAPSNGTAAISGGGVRYTPAANWHGTDRFTYEIDDGNGGTASASVEVTVSPVNDVPEAADDAATTLEDEPVTVNVLANDTDPDGDGLTVSSVTAPENGTAEVAAGGVRYTPDANWHGTDSFAYAVDDGNGGMASASVEVTVMPVNDAPAAVGTIPSQSLDEGGEPASIELSPFFSDTDGDALEYRASSSNPSVVEASVAGSVLTLVPAGYGTAEVTVTAADAGGLMATQTVAVGVSDRAARDVVSHAMAGLARSHLASVRMTLGRRTSASRTEASGLTLLGREVPLGTGAARAEAERMWSGWLSGITSRAYSQAAPGAGAPMVATGSSAAAGFGMPGAGGAAMTSTGAPMGTGTPTSPTGAPMGAGASGGATGGSGDGTSLGDLFRLGDLVPRFQGGRDPLRGSEFQFAFGGGQEAGGGGGGLRFQLWGQGDVQTFQGAPSGASDYDGELQTGYVGVDTWLSDHWMLGLAVARSRGTGDWRAGRANGSLETRLVAVHPYLQWSSGGTSLWATAGAGWGDADNVRDSGRTETSGLGLRLGLVELRQRLASGGGFELGLRTDAGWAELATDAGAETLNGQTAAVNQVRFGADLSQQIRLGGLTLAPFGEAHARRDAGAGQPGTGLELAGGLRARAGFLRIDAQGRMLAVHSVAGYEERGFGLTLSLGNLGGEGLSLSMSPRWGDAVAGGDALWQEQIYSRYAPAPSATADGHPAVNAGDPAANTRDPWALDIRGNYGLRIPGDRLLNWSASLNHSPTGPRFTLSAQLGLGLGGTSGPEPSADNGAMVP